MITTGEGIQNFLEIIGVAVVGVAIFLIVHTAVFGIKWRKK